MNVFLTGSRAYGTPTDNSDVDLAIVVESADAERLAGLADRSRGSASSDWLSLYFGRLNLICLKPAAFDAWKAANEQLKAERPVTRDRAIEVIEAAKKASGSDAMDYHVAADLLDESGFHDQAKLLRDWRPASVEAAINTQGG